MPTIIVSPFGALAVLLAVMFASEVVAKLTKGWVPSALTISILMLAGFWSGLFPKDIVELAGITDYLFAAIAGLLVTNLGTLIGRKEMAAQWKTVLISLFGIAGIVAVCLTAGAAIFGWENAVAATPPLTGGAIATTMVSTAAKESGNNTAALVAIVCLSVQGLVGYPFTSFCLKKETKRLVMLYRDGKLAADTGAEEKADGKGKKIKSVNLVLLKLTLIVVLSFWLQKLTGDAVSMYVWCLLFGFLGHAFGLVESDALSKANSYGLAITILMIYLFGGLSSSTPETILPVFGMAAALVCLSAAAMALMAFVAGKVFRQSFYMCFAVILNAFFGFPINVMLTNEALDLHTENPQERAAVSAQIMPKMLIGGFVSVTIVSVLVAGVLIRFL